MFKYVPVFERKENVLFEGDLKRVNLRVRGYLEISKLFEPLLSKTKNKLLE